MIKITAASKVEATTRVTNFVDGNENKNKSKGEIKNSNKPTCVPFERVKLDVLMTSPELSLSCCLVCSVLYMVYIVFSCTKQAS